MKPELSILFGKFLIIVAIFFGVISELGIRGLQSNPEDFSALGGTPQAYTDMTQSFITELHVCNVLYLIAVIIAAVTILRIRHLNA